MNVWVDPSSIRIGMPTTSDRLGTASRSRIPESRSITPATVRSCWTAIWYVGELSKRVTGGWRTRADWATRTDDGMGRHLVRGRGEDRTEGTVPLYPAIAVGSGQWTVDSESRKQEDPAGQDPRGLLVFSSLS